MSDMDSLLDATLDDLEDLPSFEPFWAGAHRVFATMEAKDIPGHSLTIELTLKLIETVELADAIEEGEENKEGDTANTLYFLDNEIGQGKFKTMAANFAEFAGSKKLGDIVDAVKDVECVALTARTQDKKDKTRFYMDVKEIQLV